MTNYQLSVAVRGLERIRNAVFTVELLTSRKRTAGREKTISDLDDVTSWDVAQLQYANEVGISLSKLGREAADRIETLVDAWTEHGIHGRERAKLIG